MRKTFCRPSICAALLFLFSSVITSTTLAQTVSIPSGLKDARPGTYDLTVRYSGYDQAPGAVKAMVYVPEGVVGEDRPVIVFFHGNTRDRKYYRDSVAYMTARADKYKFTLISVQNWWSLGNGDVRGANDSRRAVNLILNQLKDEDLFDPEKAYPIGFSAGGYVAVLAFLNSLNQFEDQSISLYSYEFEIDEDDVVAHYYSQVGGLEMNLYDYAGFASFKGNYYEGYVDMNPFVEEYQDRWNMLVREKTLFFAVGENDVPRVKQQAPQAADFFRMYAKVEPVYKVYPGEGHNLSEANWNDFWKLVEAD